GQLIEVMESGDALNTSRTEWKSIVEFLEGITRSRVMQGFSSDETAQFIFSFKKPLFDRLKAELGRDADALAEETWSATQVLDKLGLIGVRAFQKSREGVTNRTQEEIPEAGPT